MITNASAGHAAYKQGQVGSADPLRIVVLLYEGAIRFTRQAQEGFDEPATRGHALGRAHRILSELLAAIDHEKGGEIAENLDGLYRFALDQITRANTELDRSALDGVLRVLGELHGGWQELESRGEGARP